MTTKLPKDLSPFALAALSLDAEFVEFERLTRELERASISSETGLERARALLGELEVCRKRFEPASQALAQAMEEARNKTAAAAQLVAEREVAVRERFELADQLFSRYKALGEMVKRVNDLVTGIRQAPPAAGMTSDERAVLTERLPELDQQLLLLIDQTRMLMDDARAANIKTLVRSADSLRQTLQSARNRFGQLAGAPAEQVH